MLAVLPAQDSGHTAFGLDTALHQQTYLIDKPDCKNTALQHDNAFFFTDDDSIDSMQLHVSPSSQIRAALDISPQPSQLLSIPPLSALIAAVHTVKRMYLQPPEASVLLSQHLARALHAHPSLLSHLGQFGWSERTGWTQPLDLLGFSCSLKKFKYVRTAQLGAGSFGVVIRATDIETGEQVAIKKVAALTSSSDCSMPYFSLREITVLRELRHPHIVKLRDVIGSYGSSHMYLVLDCLDCDLRNFLNTVPQASASTTVKSIMWQILSGLAYLHSNGIVHRDLKPQNILVDKRTCLVKIGDFGLARAFLPPTKAYTPKVVTLYYRAPELLLGIPAYGSAIDMWAVGCIMAELLNFSPLFKEESEVGLIMSVFRTLGTPTESMWPGISSVLEHDFGGPVPQWPRQDLSTVLPGLKDDPLGHDLLARLLVYDPNQRISAAAALHHPWFRTTSSARHTAGHHSTAPPVMHAAHAFDPSPVQVHPSAAYNKACLITSAFMAAAQGTSTQAAVQPPRQC